MSKRVSKPEGIRFDAESILEKNLFKHYCFVNGKTQRELLNGFIKICNDQIRGSITPDTMKKLSRQS